MTEENLNIEQIVLTGDSNPDLRQRYNVEVREFVILACVCEAGAPHWQAVPSKRPTRPESARTHEQ